jgi:outer membrane protein OmpA-like peptidoglycan-associated protein
MGEAVPVWLAMIFVLLGVAGAIVAARWAVPEDLEIAFSITERPSSVGAQDLRPSMSPSGGHPERAADAPLAATPSDPAGPSSSAQAVVPPGPSAAPMPVAPDSVDGGADTPAPTSSSARAEPEASAPDTAPDQNAAIDVRDCPPVFVATFERDSDRPLVAGLDDNVAALALWLRDHPRATLLIEGHADARGTGEYNWLLSARRANAVAALLLDNGVAEHQLAVRPYGHLVPLAGVVPTAGDNRRVTMRLQGGDACSGKLGDRKSR